MESINENIRKVIANNSICFNTNYPNIEFAKKIEARSMLNSKSDIVLLRSILSMVFLDSYKVLNYKLRHQSASKKDYYTFSIIDNFDSFDDIKGFYLSKQGILMDGLLNSYEFSSENLLKKISEVRCLTEGQNEYLSSLVPFHKDDIDKYNPKVTLDYLYDYYDERINILSEGYELYDDSGLIVEICGFLREQSIDYYDEFNNIVLVLTKSVFENLDALKQKTGADNLISEDIVDLYENDPGELNLRLTNDVDLDLLDRLFWIYVNMREFNIIKNKVKEFKKD